MIDGRTLEQLDAKGYTHNEAVCGQPRCGNLVQFPFRMLLQRRNVDRHTTVAQLRQRYVCKRCGGTIATRFEPWYHSMSNVEVPQTNIIQRFSNQSRARCNA